MYINEKECEKAGVDPRKVLSIARRISRAAKEAEALNIQKFGGSSGELRYHDDPDKGPLKLAKLDGQFDGGCGADHDWSDGFCRGE